MEKNILPKQLEDITSEFPQNLFFKQIHFKWKNSIIL